MKAAFESKVEFIPTDDLACLHKAVLEFVIGAMIDMKQNAVDAEIGKAMYVPGGETIIQALAENLEWEALGGWSWYAERAFDGLTDAAEILRLARLGLENGKKSDIGKMVNGDDGINRLALAGINRLAELGSFPELSKEDTLFILSLDYTEIGENASVNDRYGDVERWQVLEPLLGQIRAHVLHRNDTDEVVALVTSRTYDLLTVDDRSAHCGRLIADGLTRAQLERLQDAWWYSDEDFAAVKAKIDAALAAAQ